MEIAKVVFHYFVRNYNANQAAQELKEIVQGRFKRLGITTPTEEKRMRNVQHKKICEIYRLVRRQIHYYVQNSYRKSKLGRFGNAVEIDESIFAQIRRDGKKEKIWVLGFYERGTKEARAIFIKDRTEDTLTQVILENVELGAEIYSDFWRGYNGLKHYFLHRVVNKQQRGNGTSEFQTTNRVEHLWATIKSSMQMYSSSFHVPHLQMFLDEAIWRRKHKSFDDRIEFLIQLN